MKPSWWRIFYADGSAFSNEDGDVRDAPRLGVVVIVQADEQVGWMTVHGFDYYYWEPALGGWFCSDLIGAFDHLIRCPTPLVLVGRMVSNKDYAALLDRIRREYGDKQGWLPQEKRP